MVEQTLQQSVLITNPQGFHLRPISAFAGVAQQFQSEVRVVKDGQSVNGCSPLELMLLAAAEGTELIIEVSGPDAREALPALVDVITTVPEELTEA